MDFAGGFGAPRADGNNGGAGVDLMSWYKELPPISRLYLTGAFITTGACAVEIISPFSLYYEWGLIAQGEVWRLVTSYLFFGLFSVDFLFHMYFLVRYSRMLEEGDFRGRTANYVWMLIFGCCAISAVATFVNVHFLGSALTFMMTYVWGRRNEGVRMAMFGFLVFRAPYLPWVMLAFSVLIGNAITMDLIGIAVGHLYYFLEFVYPVMADLRGWRVKRLMEPPLLLRWACDSFLHENDRHHFRMNDLE
ncbi:hypothetical protein MPSEU_000429200 [Mayamaea pseudoterrestris]|nr:hypothetical protein MPSEU_000429200 [Mayamaea pseudoterrestris]